MASVAFKETRIMRLRSDLDILGEELAPFVICPSRGDITREQTIPDGSGRNVDTILTR